MLSKATDSKGQISASFTSPNLFFGLSAASQGNPIPTRTFTAVNDLQSQEKVVSISQQLYYDSHKPNLQATLEAFKEKYGEPTLNDKYLDSHRYVWASSEKKSLSINDFTKCTSFLTEAYQEAQGLTAYNLNKPPFLTQWVPNCGTFIFASVLGPEDGISMITYQLVDLDAALGSYEYLIKMMEDGQEKALAIRIEQSKNQPKL